MIVSFLNALLAFLLAPLFLSGLNRTKAFFAGRQGPPWLQPYRDLAKLLRKGAVYSRTTTWVFRAAPAVCVATLSAAVLLVPFAGQPALVSFPLELVLLAYLLGLSRYAMMLAALDTGSAFEGMGASREAQFSAMAEPALPLGLAALLFRTGQLSLSGAYGSISLETWSQAGPALLLVMASLLVVFVTENARVPVDDPATHLELTMIHEVMILDHGGPDLAMLEYAAALKLWVLGSLIVGLVIPASGGLFLDEVLGLAGLVVLAGVVGAVESSMARLRLLVVPRLLAGAGALSVLALLLLTR